MRFRTKQAGISLGAAIRNTCVVLVLLVPLLSVGCAAKGPSFFQIESSIPVIPPGYGRLYFLNPIRKHARLFLDKQEIGECKYGAFFWEDVPAGSHVITADTWGDFGAWDQSIEVAAAADHFILIKERRAPMIALALLGVVGAVGEAALATESKSGPFEIEVLDPIRGKEVRSQLAFYREGDAKLPDSQSVAVQQPALGIVKVTASEDRSTSSVGPGTAKPSAADGECSMEQVLAMKGAGLSDSKIRAACR